MDMVDRRKPAGSVSMEPGIMPRPWPSRGLKRFLHDGDLRKDLSSLCSETIVQVGTETVSLIKTNCHDSDKYPYVHITDVDKPVNHRLMK